MSKTQASRSHPEDSRGEHSKASQKPSPANSQPGTTSTNVHESRDVVQKKKPTPAHLTHFHDLKGEHEETKDSSRFTNRKQGDVKEIAGAAAKARRAGPHGSVIHADGSSQAASNKHNVAKIG